MPASIENVTLPESLSNETITAIALAVAKAMPQIKTPKAAHNWIGLASLALATIVFITGGMGVWVSATNKSTALDIRLLSLEGTAAKNTRRLDDLEAARGTNASSTTQLTDLKESFDQFRLQYRDDIRDLKLQVEEAKNMKH